MACTGCNSVRSDVDAFDFYRTIHDKDFRDNTNNIIMAPNGKQRKSKKSMRRRTRKAGRRAKDAVGNNEKKQKLIAKEERTWALAWTLVAYFPPETINSLVVKFNKPFENRKYGRAAMIEKIAKRISNV